MRTKSDFLVFGRPQIADEDIAEVVDSLTRGWLGTGPKVARFEKDFGLYKGASHAVALNSCTAALHLSLLAAGIGPGDEVVTTAMTFCATVNTVIHAGATPVLADIDPTSMNIDPVDVERRITPRTKALLPVHFAGRPCDMDALGAIAKWHGLTVIEDCAHAIETEYHGRKAGTMGDFGCFSFYATKNLSTGEGGMVLTPHEQHARRIKTLALHGLSADAWRRFSDAGYKHYFVTEAGFKYNMMDLQAALGIHQLRRIEGNWLRRQQIWKRYDQAFAHLPVTTPAPPEAATRHAHHLYTLRINQARDGISRDQFLEAMTTRNIGVGVHYLSIPEHPYYCERFGWRPEDYPNAMALGRETVSIPLSARITDEDVASVVEATNAILGSA